MSATPYTIDDNRKTTFGSMLIIEAMVNMDQKFPVLLDGDDALLEPAFRELFAQDLVAIADGRYTVTPLAKSRLETFLKRYREFLTVYDVYCAVDLTAGEFAFARYYDMDEAQWAVHLADERWEDVRVAVAVYKNIDPVELVFMSFVNEGRFEIGREGWQFDLMLGSAWEDILGICNSALTIEQLGGEDVLLDIIAQGTALMLSLLQKEKVLRAAEEAAEAAGSASADEIAYYEQYNDPRFVPPGWRMSWWN